MGLSVSVSGTPECLHDCTTQGDYVGAAAKAAGELYGYGHTNVLFKPTKAREDLQISVFLHCFLAW